MYVISKIGGALIDPAMVFALLLFFVALALFVPRDGVRRFARRLLLLMSLFIAFLAVAPMGQWMLAPLETAFPAPPLPSEVQGLILLTGDEDAVVTEKWKIPAAGHATLRYLQLARLAKKYPNARIVISGTNNTFLGHDKETTRSVSEAMLTDLGIDLARVTFEDASRTTHENAVFSYTKINPDLKDKWVLVTSAYHMPRAVLSFEANGWMVTPSPSDYSTDGTFHFEYFPYISKTLHDVSLAAHEYYGLISYWMLGWIDQPWP